MDSNPYQSPDDESKPAAQNRHGPSRGEWVWLIALAAAMLLILGLMLLYGSVAGHRPLP